MLFAMVGESEATLLWDGTFHGDERRVGSGVGNGGFNDPSGSYDDYSCLPQQDSFSLVKDPYGRSGWGGKFYRGVGASYAACYNNKDMIIANDNTMKAVFHEGEFYYGWSMYLVKPFSPVTTYPTLDVGLAISLHNFISGSYHSHASIDSKADDFRLSARTTYGPNNVEEKVFSSNDKTGQWYDYIWYVKWTYSTNGFYELWERSPGQTNYTKVYEKRNIITLFGPTTDPVRYMQIRIGQYGATVQPKSQTLIIMNPKAGTTRADVEYPGTSNQNQTPTCSDGIKNQDETGIDCGGSCPACSNPEASTTQLTLKPGWNQISSSIAEGIDIAKIEQSCTVLQYKNQKLWSWNAQAQSWSNPAKVEPLKGYWVYVAYVCTVPISGTPATFSSLQLYNGWNKISASGDLTNIAGTCANHITGNWIWNWDKTTTPEKWIHPATMQLDKGYWIKVDQDCVLG